MFDDDDVYTSEGHTKKEVRQLVMELVDGRRTTKETHYAIMAAATITYVVFMMCPIASLYGFRKKYFG